MLLEVLEMVLEVLEVVLEVLQLLLELLSAWFISNFQKTVNRPVLATLQSYRPRAKIFLYKSTVPDRLEWVPGL